MAIAKVDYYSLGDTSLDCIASNDGATHTVVTAQGQDGSIVASETIGETSSPSCEYRIKAAVSAKTVSLGGVTTVGEKKYCLNNVSISTSAGNAPTFSASGEQVNSDAVTGCTYDTSVTIGTAHHAQILFNAFTLSGTGCHLQNCAATISAGISKATKNGDCIAFDVNSGTIAVNGTIVAVGSSAPTVTAADGWILTAPLACSNPDANYPTYTFTVTKYITKTSV